MKSDIVKYACVGRATSSEFDPNSEYSPCLTGIGTSQEWGDGEVEGCCEAVTGQSWGTAIYTLQKQ